MFLNGNCFFTEMKKVLVPLWMRLEGGIYGSQMGKDGEFGYVFGDFIIRDVRT